MDFFIADVKNCARCGENHDVVQFTEFTNEGPVQGKYTHWGVCPKLREPIILYIEGDDES